MREYESVCPHCESVDITMIGDPEYNDYWKCEDCKEEFGSYKNKDI